MKRLILIEKSALVAEIDRLENKLYYELENFKDVGAKMALDSLKSSLDTLEVKEVGKEPVSEDLEKAAENHSNNLDNIRGSVGEMVRNAYKAGAKWKKDKMIRNAIDAQCFGFQGAALFSFRLPADNYLVGSKVKVIVIKED